MKNRSKLPLRGRLFGGLKFQNSWPIRNFWGFNYFNFNFRSHHSNKLVELGEILWHDKSARLDLSNDTFKIFIRHSYQNL